MFDAEKYFVQIERELNSCTADVGVQGPLFSPGRHNWEVITFNLIAQFPTGEVLNVGDYWERRRRGIVMHTFNYQFMKPDGSLIFRMDSHGGEISYDGKCHVHVGMGSSAEKVLEDDDARLHGYRLTKVDFLNAFGLAHRYLKGKGMPWDPL